MLHESQCLFAMAEIRRADKNAIQPPPYFVQELLIVIIERAFPFLCLYIAISRVAFGYVVCDSQTLARDITCRNHVCLNQPICSIVKEVTKYVHTLATKPDHGNTKRLFTLNILT